MSNADHRIKVKVRELRPGDVLWPTGRQVGWVGQTARTPAGRTTLALSGRSSEVHWNSGTIVTVTRAPC